jgi:hypothetical protein
MTVSSVQARTIRANPEKSGRFSERARIFHARRCDSTSCWKGHQFDETAGVIRVAANNDGGYPSHTGFGEPFVVTV